VVRRRIGHSRSILAERILSIKILARGLLRRMSMLDSTREAWDEGTVQPSDLMRAVRMHEPGGPESLELDHVALPELDAGAALVRVHAAAITRDELEWPLDRLPAIPSYELSGVVAAVASDVTGVAGGDPVYALTPFDRDGVAAEYTAVPAEILGAKPSALSHLESAALPLAGLSAWQGLFVHGGLEAGERVLIHGAAGGVGHLATQLARECGAYVIGSASGEGIEHARMLGADEVIDLNLDFAATLEPVDLVFDTVGGDLLVRSVAVLRSGGRVVSVAEEPPESSRADITATYFVVEPDGEQLGELTRLANAGRLRTAVDSVFPLAEARAAFERVQARGKRGKVVLQIRGE
jgi:NADPH:quinone reductase-like Zn-dependent oxidoreductase